MTRLENEFQRYWKKRWKPKASLNWISEREAREIYSQGFHRAAEMIHDETCGCGDFVNIGFEEVPSS